MRPLDLKKQQRRVNGVLENKILPLWNLTAMFLCLVSVIGYLGIINHANMTAMAAAELKKEISILTENNQDLQIQVTSLQDIGRVKESASQLSMVTVSNYEYLVNTPQIVAVKR
jgi:cell division protein FtsL